MQCRKWAAAHTFGLREEKVDDWHEDSVEYCEDNVRTPPDVVDGGRCNLHDHVVDDPIRRSRD